MRITIRGAAAALGLWAMVAAGCGEGPGSTTESPQGGPLVTYARSGGIAGVYERLRINSDGSALASVGIDADQTAFELSGDELERLRGELDAAGLGSVDTRAPPTGCADCFVYELTYGGRTISYDESRPPAEPVTAVVSDLGKLLADHYPTGSAAPPAGG